MAMIFIDPVVEDYLFHNSPLKTARGKWSLGIVVSLLLVLSVIGWKYFLHGRNIFAYLEWIPLSIIGSIIGYLIFAFFDRERRVWFFHIFVILVVLFFMTSICAFFNTVSPAPKLTVGFVEEGFKILPVFLLAIYVPNLIRTRKDGLVYGAMAGMGLNIIEIGSYIAMALSKGTVLEALTTHLTRLGLWGIGSHIIWSGFIGLGIGMAMESNNTGWAKWKPAVIFYLLAAVAHSVFDLGASVIGIFAWLGIQSLFGIDTQGAFAAENSSKLGPFNNSMRYGTYAYNAAFLIVEIIQIRKSFAMENALQVEELSAEPPMVVNNSELDLIKGERLFFKRKYIAYPKHVGDKIVLYQNLLAIQKHADRQKGQAVETDEVILNLRQAIDRLRGS